MISFLESADAKNKIEIKASFGQIETVLKKGKANIGLIKNLIQHKLKCKDFHEIEDYEFIFSSSHKRKKKANISLYHIVLDYNDIVVE